MDQTTHPALADYSALQREIDDLRDRLQRREDAERQAACERREARQREWLARLRTAAAWPDAIQKGLLLARKEAALERADAARYPDEDIGRFFIDWLKELERLRELYFEAMDQIEPVIARLRRQALTVAADRLAKEFGEDETVEALRQDNPAFLVDW